MRSTSAPVSGEGRNIAATCREMTRPASPTEWPWSRMWTGVMVITATITIWVSTIAAAATRRVRGAAGASGAPPPARSSAAPMARAVPSGSGRRSATTATAASA